MAKVAEPLGETTNNIAEYQGLIAGLELALNNEVKRLEVFMDSLLVVEQMRGNYKVKHAGLKPLHAKASGLASQLAEVSFEAIPRAENSEADRLANEAMDRSES